MARKVGFIGTHGVGKTILTFSLASELRKFGIDADVAYENSRLSPFPINESTTFDSQLWILTTQIKTELEISRRCDLVVTDRSVLDNYAYMVRACGPQEVLHPFIERWLETYDLFFLVPIIDTAVVADRMRSTAPPFQREIDRIVRHLVEVFGMKSKVIELPLQRSEHVSIILDGLKQRSLVGQQPTLF